MAPVPRTGCAGRGLSVERRVDLMQGRFRAGVYCRAGFVRAGLWLRVCYSFAAGCEVPALLYFRMLCVRVGVVPLFLRGKVLRGDAADGLSRACQ